VPAITELARVDPAGIERLRVSRIETNVVDTHVDVSKEPRFVEAVAHGKYYGPVYFRDDSEPYMTLALAGALRDSGVTIAKVNFQKSLTRS
jgi:two-component system, NtrC family, sensor kinase